MNSAHPHSTGLNRREILQVGYSGLLGMGLAALPVGASSATPPASRKRKSVILVFLTGGPSQLDTFDMKPAAPASGNSRNNFCRPWTKALAVLLDDLEATGLLGDTLVLLIGEFGRTPKIGPTAGREHWPACFFGLFAGAGVRGGQLIGSSDSIGAYPATAPYSPSDVGATVYHILGVDPATEVQDRQSRPTQLNRGQVIQGLFTGA